MKVPDLDRPMARTFGGASLIAITILLAMSCLLGSQAVAFAEQYVIDIRQVDTDEGKQVTMSCRGDANRLCEGEIVLSVQGKSLPVSVAVQIEPGNAYFRFRARGTTLLANSQPYVRVAVGRTRTATRPVALAVMTELARDDAGPLLHRPVIRTPAYILGTLQLDLRAIR